MLLSCLLGFACWGRRGVVWCLLQSIGDCVLLHNQAWEEGLAGMKTATKGSNWEWEAG